MKIIKRICAIIILLYILLIIIAYLPTATLPVEKLTGPSSTFINVNGHTIHYTQQGQGQPLVLVHGFAGSVFTWRSLIPLLSDKYTVYALDLLGFGLSDKPSDNSYDMRSQANLLLAFLEELELDSAILVGHSMGGVVVAYAAIEKPSKVDRLIIIEGGFYHGGAPEFVQYLFFPLQRLMAKTFYTRKFRLKSLLPSYFNKSIVTTEVIEAYLQPGKTPNAVNALETMMTNVGPRTYEGVSRQVTQPTLLVWSLNNKNNPVEDGKRLNNEISNSQLNVIQNCGHYVQEEKPEELAAVIKQFLYE